MDLMWTAVEGMRLIAKYLREVFSKRLGEEGAGHPRRLGKVDKSTFFTMCKAIKEGFERE